MLSLIICRPNYQWSAYLISSGAESYANTKCSYSSGSDIRLRSYRTPHLSVSIICFVICRSTIKTRTSQCHFNIYIGRIAAILYVYLSPSTAHIHCNFLHIQVEDMMCSITFIFILVITIFELLHLSTANWLNHQRLQDFHFILKLFPIKLSLIILLFETFRYSSNWKLPSGVSFYFAFRSCSTNRTSIFDIIPR